jgi:hypothetical protein
VIIGVLADGTKEVIAIEDGYWESEESWAGLLRDLKRRGMRAPVKARTRQTKGAGSRKAGLAMAFKLALAAEAHWRRVNAPHLVALVRAGIQFRDGVQVPPHVEEHHSQEVEELPQGVAT